MRPRTSFRLARRVAALVVFLSVGSVWAQGADPAKGDGKPSPAAGGAPSPAPKGGPSPDDLEKAKQHFARGKELFDKKEFKPAALEFREAYRLTKNPLLLYNIGYTLEQMGQEAKALGWYRQFLKDAPEGAPNRDFVNERMKAIESGEKAAATEKTETKTETKAETKAETKSKGTKKKGKKPAPAEEPEGALQHNVVKSAPPGLPLDVTAFVNREDWQVNLYFRVPGQEKFTEVQMSKRYSELVARIPASTTKKTSTIQYYLEARDANGNVTARSGRFISPNVVFVERGASPRYYPDFAGGVDLEESETSSSEPFIDVRGKPYQTAKWATTGGFVAFAGLGVTFYMVARQSSLSILAEARASTETDICPMGNPCRAYSQIQDEHQEKGQKYEGLSKWMYAGAAVTAVAAGALWYFDLTGKSKGEAGTAQSRSGSFLAAPFATSDAVGAAAVVEF